MPIIQTLQKVAHTRRQARPKDIPGRIQTTLTHLMEQQSTTKQPLKTVIRYSQRFLAKDKESKNFLYLNKIFIRPGGPGAGGFEVQKIRLMIINT